MHPFIKISFFKIDGWTTDDLVYKWKDDEPVQIVKDLNLPRFKLEEYSTDYCNTVTNTGMYFAQDCLSELKYLILWNYRRIQLFESSIGFQKRILLLSSYNLRSILHVSDSFMGFILVGFKVSSSKSIFR